MAEVDGRLVVVTPQNADKVEKVNDAGNRAVRVFANSGAVTYGLYMWEKYLGGLPVAYDDIMLGLPFLMASVAYLWRWLEYKGVIKFFTVPDAVSIAAPTDAAGNTLGQVKP